MKLTKILLLAISIPALATVSYAGGSCKGGCGDKDETKEKASVTNVQSLCGGSCPAGGDKGEGKEKA